MKRFGSTVIFLFSCLLFLITCTKQLDSKILEIDGLSFVRKIPLEYATTFCADVYKEKYLSERSEVEESDFPEYTLLTVLGTDQYLLVPEGGTAPKNLPSEISIINLPVHNAYLAATSAMSLVCALDSLGSIRFSSVQKKDWFVDEAKQAMEEGRILFSGKYNAPDFELLLKENCSLAIESTMIYHTPQIKEKMESLGIPVFVDKSSYEENPFGRLEWIKVYGLLTGKFTEAEDFFAEQVKKISPKNQNDGSDIKKIGREVKIAFFYVTPSGMVVIRGSDDYIVKMIEMAGKSSLFSDFKAFKTGEIYVTGKSLYQSTDKIGEVILDLRSIVLREQRDFKFLQKIDFDKE